MCVIICKLRGVAMPPEEVLIDCWLANPDGAGYAICRAGSTVSEIHKGFMEPYDLLIALDSENIQPEDLVLIHFRIATAGKIDGPTCHPFPISDRLQTLRKLHATCDRVMVHNGVIHNNPPRIMSDTQKFVLQVLAHMDRFDSLDARIGDLISGSRIAMIDRGVLRIAGQGWAWHAGCLYSNMYWQCKCKAPAFKWSEWPEGRIESRNY